MQQATQGRVLDQQAKQDRVLDQQATQDRVPFMTFLWKNKQYRNHQGQKREKNSARMLNLDVQVGATP